ncbi:hypothetical protein [Thalassobellus sediminis]|uniref:hypothetical protein n=1 Tax=Thalassobellus sediminis TaxID=3367753 RepID=UPI00379BA722
MNKKNSITSFFLIVIPLFMVSCLRMPSDINNWINIDNIKDIKGTYHFLSDDGIKIYLPESFKKYSIAEYQHLLDSLTTKEDYQLEIKRLQHLKQMKGNFYIFFEEDTRSTYTINTMPYMPLNKQDAQYILGLISMNNKKVSKKTDLEFTKITAKYNSNSNVQIFKAIHRIDNYKKKSTSFNSSYVVSSNKKTIYVQLLTGFEANFDLFLQKMIL